MKKTLVLLVTAGMLVMILTGCGGGSPLDEDTLSGNITVAGSTSVAPIAEVLAEEFMDIHSGVTIDVQSSGSSAGIQAAQTQAAEIGMSSRELNPEEKTVHEFVIAQDGIVVVVNNANAVNDITLEQVRKIYTGEITNWSELGGADAAITAVTRESGSGTRGAFEDIVMNKEEIASTVIVQGSTGAVRTAVKGDPDAVGYISLAALDDSVSILKINGVAGTMLNIQNGSYAIARPFLFLTHDAPEGIVKEFIDYALSSEGQALAQEEGLIPVR